jgi:Zn-dependent oligopeptidase
VIVKDLVQKLLGEGFSPAMGLQYRRAILEPGSTKDSVQLIRDFLGRDYSYVPFYKWTESEVP